MPHKPELPFDSIESAHDFVSLLSEVVTDAKRDLEEDIKREADSKFPRRLDAFRIALYGLEKLESHMVRSGRILNDLRSLRRLLFEERASVQQAAAKPKIPKAEASAVPVAPPVLVQVETPGGNSGSLLAA